MCGITLLLKHPSNTADIQEKRQKLIKVTEKHLSRGPDATGYYVDDYVAIGHNRLAINDPASGHQPIIYQHKENEEDKFVLAANGEIYNHQDLVDQYHTDDYIMNSRSDCESLAPLLKNFPLLDYTRDSSSIITKLNEIDGPFAFVLYNYQSKQVIIARDPLGIMPLYWGFAYDNNDNRNIWYSSNVQSLSHCSDIWEVEPGTFEVYKPNGFNIYLSIQTRYYEPIWNDANFLPTMEPDYLKIYNLMEKAILKRLECDVPYGFLLSGGLDSSIVAAIGAKHAKERIQNEHIMRDSQGHVQKSWYPQVHTFTIGMLNDNGEPISPDFEYARQVAEYIGSVHHEFTFTFQDTLDVLEDVIRSIETYDTTTVRASVPCYLLARKVKAFGIKMVLSGEGFDESWGGYMAFHYAPNAEEFFYETRDKVNRLYKYDLKRANMTAGRWGLEIRVPSLDLEFLDYAMQIDAQYKMIHPEARHMHKTSGQVSEQCMEKYILRKTFEDELPESVIWRQKDQFSDSVGADHIERLKEHASTIIEDSEFDDRLILYPENTPRTKEEFLYRKVFEEIFGDPNKLNNLVPEMMSISCSTKRALEWNEAFQNNADDSGRSCDVHENYKNWDDR